jgi:TetR/AcrR family transcriptional repressor of lmrAB and yxaGH operons
MRMSQELPARDRILDATAELMEQQGYFGTGLKEIIEHSHTPKGSLYHYFPDGKEEIAEVAINRKSEMIQARIAEHFAIVRDPAEAVRSLLLSMAQHARMQHCRKGNPLATVALETANSSERIRQACVDAYEAKRQLFYDKFVEGGIEQVNAQKLATTCLAAIEGAFVLVRTMHNAEPLETVADMLYAMINAESPT